MEQKTIKEFTDLLAWQAGHQLVLDLYRETNKLPASERFNLVSQLQRAAISTTSNIAEGFSRKSFKDKIHFMYIAFGSSKEVQNQLIICKDLKYFNEECYYKLITQNSSVNRLLFGLIKSLEERINSNQPTASRLRTPAS